MVSVGPNQGQGGRCVRASTTAVLQCKSTLLTGRGQGHGRLQDKHGARPPPLRGRGDQDSPNRALVPEGTLLTEGAGECTRKLLRGCTATHQKERGSEEQHPNHGHNRL